MQPIIQMPGQQNRQHCEDRKVDETVGQLARQLLPMVTSSFGKLLLGHHGSRRRILIGGTGWPKGFLACRMVVLVFTVRVFHGCMVNQRASGAQACSLVELRWPVPLLE